MLFVFFLPLWVCINVLPARKHFIFAWIVHAYDYVSMLRRLTFIYSPVREHSRRDDRARSTSFVVLESGKWTKCKRVIETRMNFTSQKPCSVSNSSLNQIFKTPLFSVWKMKWPHRENYQANYLKTCKFREPLRLFPKNDDGISLLLLLQEFMNVEYNDGIWYENPTFWQGEFNLEKPNKKSPFLVYTSFFDSGLRFSTKNIETCVHSLFWEPSFWWKSKNMALLIFIHESSFTTRTSIKNYKKKKTLNTSKQTKLYNRFK